MFVLGITTRDACNCVVHEVRIDVLRLPRVKGWEGAQEPGILVKAEQ